MFTGIIQAVGQIAALKPRGTDLRLCIDSGSLALDNAQLGDSIAVSGVCLTATQLDKQSFWADVSAETLSRTILGDLQAGSKVNLEPALTLSTPLGGHLVSGHVDGIGSVTRFSPEGRSWCLNIQAPDALARYIAPKGSICIDGVSLTVNEVEGSSFGVNIVPHTLEQTTLADFKPGRQVNLEVDIIARYLERLLMAENTDAHNKQLHQLLQQRGFM